VQVRLLATKPMQLASYFCTGTVPEEAWAHYALGFDRYSHGPLTSLRHLGMHHTMLLANWHATLHVRNMQHSALHIMTRGALRTAATGTRVPQIASNRYTARGSAARPPSATGDCARRTGEGYTLVHSSVAAIGRRRWAIA
jgi:hypothetical protein